MEFLKQAKPWGLGTEVLQWGLVANTGRRYGGRAEAKM